MEEQEFKINVYGLDVIVTYYAVTMKKIYHGIMVSFELVLGEHKNLFDFHIMDMGWAYKSDRDEIFDIFDEITAKKDFLEAVERVKNDVMFMGGSEEAKFVRNLDVEGFIKDLKERMSQ